MKLSQAEFKAMNGGLRGWSHRRIEFPLLRNMGLDQCAGRDVVELGCGNGLGGELIAKLGPRSYVGLDVMPEQIELAHKRGLANARFMVGDASNVSELSDACADVVVVFGILHHVEHWERAVAECGRLLRSGGLLVIEEPETGAIRLWDRVFHWDHPHSGFSLPALERRMRENGLLIERQFKLPLVFGWYSARKSVAAGN